MSDSADLLITGGTIVDGTGAPGRPGTVVVDGERLRIIWDQGDSASGASATSSGASGASATSSGASATSSRASVAPSASPSGASAASVRARDATLPAHARRTIDATGKVVAPGFIDLHSHGGLHILAEPRHEPKVRQGVTTEIVGVDGNGFAPFASRAELEAFVELDSGLDGRPDIDYDWLSVADYLARMDGAVSANIGTLVGNSQLRIGAMGWDDRPAGAADLDRMAGLLRDAMADGAVGLSSGLDYPPGSYATTGELAALTRVAGEHGGFYHSHVRYPLGDRYLDPFREAIEIGRRGEAPAHITHLYHRRTYPGGPEALLALIDEARAEGLDVTFDSYPSEWASTRLLIQLPIWMQDGGVGPLKERLADRAIRERARAELATRGAAYASSDGWSDVRLGAFRRPDLLRWESRSVADVMDETGRDAVDVICDLLLAEDLGVNQVTTGPWLPTMRPFIAHPVGLVGTDSTFVGAKPAPRTYGSFPRILGQFVRDERLLSLEEAVRKMTGAAAARLGLRERGVLRDGAYADIVVFDPATVRSNATYDEPRQFPDGIDHVIVNGILVVDGATHTGATPGRGIRLGVD